MRFLCFIGLSYFLCFHLKAQNIDYIFKEELSTLITEKEGKTPYAFEIIKEKYTSTSEKPSTKRITEFYKKTIVFAEKATNDSLKIAQLKSESKSTSGMNEVEVNIMTDN